MGIDSILCPSSAKQPMWWDYYINVEIAPINVRRRKSRKRIVFFDKDIYLIFDFIVKSTYMVYKINVDMGKLIKTYENDFCIFKNINHTILAFWQKNLCYIPQSCSNGYGAQGYGSTIVTKYINWRIHFYIK